MTYDYVDHAIQDADKPPPFEIPHLCFLHMQSIQIHHQDPFLANGRLVH